MKNWITRLTILFFLVTTILSISASNYLSQRPTTIILVRHAEKAAVEGNDPDLSDEGKRRAARLSASFPRVSPDLFYSTAYIRTRSTLAPWAKQTRKEVQPYDAAKQPEFADFLKTQTGKTIVVAGHSNTIPRLVNLLLNEDKFPDLADNEYDKIFVVTIDNGKSSAKVLTY